jgi:hypothetical protein
LPKASVPKKQLQKLKAAGLYSGKVPRGGTLSRYQQRLIKRFDAVATGKATVLSPKNPASFKGIFDVQGKHVIVPKGKGEKWNVNKSGGITRTRKGPRGEPIKFSSWRAKKPGDIPKPPPPEKRERYALPFARKVGSGQYRLEWQRFPDYASLQKFMTEYETPDPVTGKARYPDWTQYVFIESIDDERPLAERNAALKDAAIKHGRAKAEHFVGSSSLDSTMRQARKVRRNKRRKFTAKIYGER